MLTVAVACYGLALMTLVPPILQRLDGMSYAGLVGLCISLGITLLSPIGGKLGDIFGRKAVVVIAGLVNLVCGVGIAYASNVLVLLICCNMPERAWTTLTGKVSISKPFVLLTN